ncbi:MAG: hypothetical protein AAF694_27490, partial [Bacteroidota bacterium]
MRKNLLLLSCLGIGVACQPSSPSSSQESTEPILANTTAIPQGFELLSETWGDLNKDGVEEWVRIYNTDSVGDFGRERELHIFEKNYVEGNWDLLYYAKKVVLPDAHGGIMGDPFGELSVENGAVVLRQQGGSRYKWSYIHRFRYQAEKWQLIGTTIETGAPCEMWEHFDYNLSTGKIIYTKELENCETDPTTSVESREELFHKLPSLPQMDGFYPGDNEVALRDTLSFYF